jgi:hypothetical protein
MIPNIYGIDASCIAPSGAETYYYQMPGVETPGYAYLAPSEPREDTSIQPMGDLRRNNQSFNAALSQPVVAYRLCRGKKMPPVEGH